MTFYNNDKNVIWPRIMLTGGSDTAPNLNNVLRQTINYTGKEQDESLVEWEMMPLTNGSPLWVVFQYPNQQFKGSGMAQLSASRRGIPSSCATIVYFVSSNNGASFQPATGNPLVKLTVTDAGVITTPLAQIFTDTIDFDTAKIGAGSRAQDSGDQPWGRRADAFQLQQQQVVFHHYRQSEDRPRGHRQPAGGLFPAIDYAARYSDFCHSLLLDQ